MSSSAISGPLHLRRPLVLADVIPGSRVRDVLLVLGGAAFTGLMAQIAIPVAGSPVPVTGQTFAALTVGAALGWQRGAASLAFYMLAGMAGMPWYADGGSGFNFPSFGYVIGFVFAAGIVGALASRGGDRSPLRTIGTMLLGNAVVYLFGLAYLMYDLNIGLGTAWDIGMKNYLLGDALKILLAAGLLPVVWRGVDALHKR
ncbi:MAG: biotin biosynthesis protein BioY [Marmoricola sp.]|jgi:biotin transport system substrate-specific component|nr:biotin biosynthesis protein BioY [Marmoricola sp.]